MDGPRKILHVLTGMVCGGTELRTLDMLRRVDRRRFEFHICSLTGEPGTLDDEVRRLGGHVHLLRLGWHGFAARFRRLLRQQAIDVVHAHVHYASGFLVRLAAQAGTPVRIAHFHTSQDTPGGPIRGLLRRVKRHWMDRYATHILACSEGAMAAAWTPAWRDDPRCRVVFDGLDIVDFPPPPDRAAVLAEFRLPPETRLHLHVGRMTEAKNHLRLLAIFAAVARREPAARLLLVGPGGNEIERDVRHRVEELRLTDRVVFGGERRDVPRLVQAADVLVFPSLWEGLPGAVLEACAVGTPVVASDIPSVREIAGRLPGVEPLSLSVSDDDWAAAIGRVLTQQPSRSARLAARERFAASEFGIEHCVAEMCGMWGEGRGVNEVRKYEVRSTEYAAAANSQSCNSAVLTATLPRTPYSVLRTADSPRPVRRLKILHLFGRLSYGGAEVRTLELLRRADRRRFEFHCCSLSGLPGELDDDVRSLGGRVFLLRQGSPVFARRFRRLLEEEQFDVVHSHLHYLSGHLLRLAAECGVPVRVAHFRSTQSDVVRYPWRMRVRRLLSPWVQGYAGDAVMRGWLDQSATDILAVSRWAMTSAWGPQWADDPRCRVVYNGIEPAALDAGDPMAVRREFGIAPDAPLCIHVGRMAEPKNHLRLAAVFAAVVRRQPAARLLLVGRADSPAIAARLKARLAELHISDQVVFAGQRPDVPRLVSAADAMIFPSLWEGLPGAVLEAAAAGTPVVASDLPSIREIAAHLPDVETVALAEPDEHWAAAVEAALASRPDEAQRAAARRTFAASVFSLDRATETMCRIWRGGTDG